MQAFSAWSPPGGTLGAILAQTRRRVSDLFDARQSLEAALEEVTPIPSMAAALQRREVGVVAELKRRSPSRGAINVGLSPDVQARAYVTGGAAAISVLTEPLHFGGSPADLVAARTAAALPMLKKDFHVDPIQLLEARVLGASAVLLIARALDPRSLDALVAEAQSLGLEAVVEVRTESELERALATPATIIGVNSRDLESLAIDPLVPARLIPQIPPGRIAIAESGILDRSGVERAAAFGADAVLVGSALSASGDPAAAVRSLTGVRRVARAA